MSLSLEPGDVEKYCVCGSEFTDNEDSKWIACDNPTGCSIEWFHIECVGLTDETVPDGEWYCDQCQLVMEQEKAANQSNAPQKGEGNAPSQQWADTTEKKKRPKPTQQLLEKCSQSTDTQDSTGSHHTDDVIVPEPDAPAKKSRRSSSYGSKSDISQVSDITTHSATNKSQGGSSEQAAQESAEHSTLSEEKHQFLRQFSDEEIIAEMARREEAFVCVCGIVFEDQSLYYLHKGCHNTNNPKKCSFCGYEAKDYYDFTSHFFQHKKSREIVAN